jgi:hypothetical protein
MNSAVMIRFLVLPSSLVLLALPAAAQLPEARPGEKAPTPTASPTPATVLTPGSGPGTERDREKGDRGDRRDWRGGGMPGFGKSPGRHDGFDQLPEPEKKRVRAALDKVWTRPEVLAARDRAMKANEDFRDAMRDALKAIDPEVVTIMERIRPPEQHFDPRKLPPLPPPDSNEFPRVVLQRMGLELWGYARPDRREDTKKLHDRIVASPPLREAVTKVLATQGEARNAAMQNLRQVYRDEVNKEFQAARDRRGSSERDRDRERDKDKDKDRDGSNRPPGPPPQR